MPDHVYTLSSIAEVVKLEVKMYQICGSYWGKGMHKSFVGLKLTWNMVKVTVLINLKTLSNRGSYILTYIDSMLAPMIAHDLQ
jgi:hypothetical protein